MLSSRRYDIDWIRVIAIGLLVIYHTAIGFQPWGMMIAFITNEKSWVSLWTPMSMLNIWRIPLLFFVSGMGVHFAIRDRNWKQLQQERAGRILIPFLFGFFCIVPVHFYIWSSYYKMDTVYMPSPGHLWFLGNIFVYVLIFSPLFFYLKRNEGGILITSLKKLMGTPFGLVPVFAAFVAEVLIVKPQPYEFYVMNSHGFFLGLLAFFFGYCFVLGGEGFLNMIVRGRWLFLSVAVALFAYRTSELHSGAQVPQYLLPVESLNWIFSVLAFGNRYLNRPSPALRYLSQAAYPVYILHMAFLYLGSMLIFRTSMNVQLQYVLVVLFTFVGCFGTYEIIRRVKILRLLFGLGLTKEKAQGEGYRAVVPRTA
jgi:glucan biosynthesis protein C